MEGTIWDREQLPQEVALFLLDRAIDHGCERQKLKREFNREAALKGLGK